MESENNPINQNFTIDAKLSINSNGIISEVVAQVIKILENDKNFDKEKILTNFNQIPKKLEKNPDSKKLSKKLKKISKQFNQVINELDNRLIFLEKNSVDKSELNKISQINQENRLEIQELKAEVEKNKKNKENNEKIKSNERMIKMSNTEFDKYQNEIEKNLITIRKKISHLQKNKDINFIDSKVEEIFMYFKKELENNNINYTPNRLKLKRRFFPEKIIDRKKEYPTLSSLLLPITKTSSEYPTVFNLNIKKLLEKTPEILNTFLPSCETALTNITQKNRHDLLPVLLKNGADSNMRDKKGITPLEHAINENFIECAEILLEHKADPNAKSERANSLVHRAIYLGRPEILLLLLHFGGDCNNDLYCKYWKPVFQAALSNRYLELQIMLDFGVSVKGMYNGYTPVLLSAIKGGDYDREERQFRLLALLIENGADVEMDYCGKYYHEYLKDKTKLRLREFKLLKLKNDE